MRQKEHSRETRRVNSRGGGAHSLVLEAFVRKVLFGPRDGERARRLRDGARVLENVLDRRARLVGVHEHDLVNERFADPERLLTNHLDRHAVGEGVNLVEHDAVALRERAVHGVGARGLDADDLDVRAQPLDVGRDAGDEAAAADRDEDGVDWLRALPKDLEADRALPGDDERALSQVRRTRRVRLVRGEGRGVSD